MSRLGYKSRSSKYTGNLSIQMSFLLLLYYMWYMLLFICFTEDFDCFHMRAKVRNLNLNLKCAIHMMVRTII